MKKLILLLGGILIVIYIVLSLLDMNGGYNAERHLWRIDHQLNYIAAHNESTPEYSIDQLANKYRDFIHKYNTTVYSKEAQLKLGDLYALRKNYAQARVEYQKAICQDKEISAKAEFTIAKTYEVEGDWPTALAIYTRVIHAYPLTNSGFFTPLYLASHNTQSDDQQAYKEAAYTKALMFYKGIAAQYPKSKTEFNALRMLSICEINLKDWSGAVRTMADMMLKYPNATALKEGVNTINLLCVTKLHNYDLAINIYKEFIRKYPNHLADPTLKKMIKDLLILKNKNAVIRAVPAAAVSAK